MRRRPGFSWSKQQHKVFAWRAYLRWDTFSRGAYISTVTHTLLVSLCSPHSSVDYLNVL